MPFFQWIDVETLHAAHLSDDPGGAFKKCVWALKMVLSSRLTMSRQYFTSEQRVKHNTLGILACCTVSTKTYADQPMSFLRIIFIKWKYLTSPCHNMEPRIPVWLSNSLASKVWDEITYPFPNFNSCTIKIWEWISNLIPHFIMDLITYPWWN